MTWKDFCLCSSPDYNSLAYRKLQKDSEYFSVKMSRASMVNGLMGGIYGFTDRFKVNYLILDIFITMNDIKAEYCSYDS